MGQNPWIDDGESGHPVFRGTSPLSRGTLQSKGGGKLSIHFCADGETIETVFRTIISVKQLSIYGAVSDLCDEYRACQARTGRPVLTGQSDPVFEPASLWMTTRTLSTGSCTRKDIAEALRTSGKALTTRSTDKDLYWCKIPENSWSWTTLHDKTYWWVLTIYRTSDMSWIHFAKMKNHLTRKVGFEGTPKFGLCWKSQPATCKVNMEWKSELNLQTKTILTRGPEFLMDWTSWSQTWSTRSTTTTSRRLSQRRRKYLRVQVDRRLKQNREDLQLLAHLQGLYIFLKENGLILNQELNSIKRTQ